MALENPWYRMIARLQDEVSRATVDFWADRGAQTIHLPLTTGSISSPMGLGSDSLPVQVELGGTPTYLADSMQFMLEYGCRLTGTDTYYIMPSFRGEQPDTSHLSQFFHSEAEISGDMDAGMQAAEDYTVHLVRSILAKEADAIAQAGGDLAKLESFANSPKFQRITFDEAAKLLDGNGVRSEESWRTLTREGERAIMDKLGEFTWVTHWDHLSVPFYQAFADGSEDRACNADLLFGLGETLGLGERHESSDEVRRALKVHEVSLEPYEWYCEMRDVAPLRTTGFGMGLERFFMWLLNHDDIRDMQLLPRAHGFNIVP
ncbi:asparagine synthetase A [Streptomyces sp. Ag109_G2-6]|uniref:asparagine synthetase A n=1 Tax=Streptomyces sp. Ag109_G2-6 TaxID=2485154 RepID=UPI000F4D3322|nr:asparagine synthetase A [Streptomyces sp. Ag109_G2-6]